MTASKEYISKIKLQEGLKLGPYQDGGGVATIGYGSTYYPNGTRVTIKDKPIDEPTAYSILITILNRKASDLTTLLQHNNVTLSQNQFDSCLDFVYNAGIAAFVNSTLWKKIEANTSDPDIAVQFKRWVYDEKGKVEPGLVTRCQWRADNYFKAIV